MVFGAFIVGLLALIAWMVTGSGGGFSAPETSRLPPGDAKLYEKTRSLFVNKAERAFFIILSQHLGTDYLLMTKTRLEDVIGVRRDVRNDKLRWALRGRVKSRHVDFLVCARDGTPLLGIELDGSSHLDMSAQNGDDLKDRIFEAAGLAFIRVNTGEDFELTARRISRKLMGG